MSQTHFELYRDASDEWRWRLRAGNGQIVAVSGEGYRRRNDAQSAIATVKAAGREDVPIEYEEGDDGE